MAACPGHCQASFLTAAATFPGTSLAGRTTQARGEDASPGAGSRAEGRGGPLGQPLTVDPEEKPAFPTCSRPPTFRWALPCPHVKDGDSAGHT